METILLKNIIMKKIKTRQWNIGSLEIMANSFQLDIKCKHICKAHNSKLYKKLVQSMYEVILDLVFITESSSEIIFHEPIPCPIIE